MHHVVKHRMEKDLAVRSKKGTDRSIKTGGFIYPVTGLLDVVALLWNPQGK